MFAAGFNKVAEYDEIDHIADLYSTDHKHLAKKDPNGYVKPMAVVGGMLAGIGAVMGGLGHQGARGLGTSVATTAGVGAVVGAGIGALGAYMENKEIREAKKTSLMGDSERKAYYRGMVRGLEHGGNRTSIVR